MSATVVRCGQLIDGLGATVPDASVRIEDGTITSVGSWSQDPLGGGGEQRPAEILDFSQYTVLPGLIEGHAHLGLLGDALELSPAEIAAHIFANGQRALREGFTTLRDAGGIDGGAAACFNQGLIPGPAVYPSGPFLTQSGGHGDRRGRWHSQDMTVIPGLVQVAIICDGVDDITRAVRDSFRRGSTQIKVTVSGGVASGGDLNQCQFTIEELTAAVHEATAQGSYVHAHAHSSASIRHGMDAGIRHFEHGSLLDADTAQLMQDTGASLVPTLLILQRLISAASGSKAAELGKLMEAMGRSVKLAYDAGVQIGSGSDLVGTDQHGRGEEIALKAAILGPMTAIMSSTSVNAAIMGIADRVGSVAEGKDADLLVIDGDPLKDPALLAQPDKVVCVIRNGRIVHETNPRAA